MSSPADDFSLNSTFYNSSYTSPSKTPPWVINVPESYRISFTMSYALILILSVVGNTSIIVTVARNPAMQSTINYLIANMAVTDLASSVVVTARVFSVMHNLSREWDVPGAFGNILCKLCPFIRDVSLLVSIHSMVAIAFDRFFAVVFPMKGSPRFLDVRLLLPFIWLEAFGFYSVYIIRFRVIFIQGVGLCYPMWPSGFDRLKSERIFYLILLSLTYTTPLVIITILYAIIALNIRNQNIPGRQPQAHELRRRKLNNKIIKMALVIVLSFLACWSPYHILVLLKIFLWRENLPENIGLASDITILISYVSLVVNPYICFLFSSNYRKYSKSVFPFSLLFASRILPLDLRGGTASLVQQTELFALGRLVRMVETKEIRRTIQ